MAEHMNWFKSLAGDSSRKMYAISTETADPAGVCGLTSIDYINSRAEFSLYIGPQYQQNGCGGRALHLLLSKAFCDLNLNCVWGESFEGNPAERVFSRLGFHLDGTRREFYFREGKYINANLWSITRDEFHRLNNA